MLSDGESSLYTNIHSADETIIMVEHHSALTCRLQMRCLAIVIHHFTVTNMHAAHEKKVDWYPFKHAFYLLTAISGG